MLCRILITIAVLVSALTQIQAADESILNRSFETPPFISKSHHKKKDKDCRGPRGHKGRRGHKGKNGQNGQNGQPGTNGTNAPATVDGFYAHVFFQVFPTDPDSKTFPVNMPIIFNQMTQVKGVGFTPNTDGSLTIQSAGDYLISYYLYADIAPGSTGQLHPTYVAVVKNNSIVPNSIIGNRVRDMDGPIFPIAGKMIVSLAVGDKIQLEPIGPNSPTARFPQFADPLKVASLTIRKLSPGP